MIKVYTGFKSFAVLIVFALGSVLLLGALGWGFARAVEFFSPILVFFAYGSIGIFVLVLLPLGLVKHLRPRIGAYCLTIAHVLGAAAWFLAFIYVMKDAGIWGILLVFSFQFLGALAFCLAVLKSAWGVAVHLAAWTSFAYLARLYAQWLLIRGPGPSGKDNVIDVDAVVIKNRGEDI